MGSDGKKLARGGSKACDVCKKNYNVNYVFHKINFSLVRNAGKNGLVPYPNEEEAKWQASKRINNVIVCDRCFFDILEHCFT